MFTGGGLGARLSPMVTWGRLSAGQPGASPILAGFLHYTLYIGFNAPMWSFNTSQIVLWQSNLSLSFDNLVYPTFASPENMKDFNFESNVFEAFDNWLFPLRLLCPDCLQYIVRLHFCFLLIRLQFCSAVSRSTPTKDSPVWGKTSPLRVSIPIRFSVILIICINRMIIHHSEARHFHPDFPSGSPSTLKERSFTRNVSAPALSLVELEDGIISMPVIDSEWFSALCFNF